MFAAALATVGIFSTDLTVGQKVAAVVGTVVVTLAAGNLDYFLRLALFHWARLQSVEARLSQLQAQIGLVLRIRPLVVTGFRQQGPDIFLVLAEDERIDLRSAERLLIVDTLGESQVVAKAAIADRAGSQPIEALLFEMEDDFAGGLRERMRVYERSVPDHIVVFREGDIQRTMEQRWTAAGGS